MTPRLNLLHVDSGAIGYGRLGVELAKALRRLGVETFTHLPSPDLPEGTKCASVCWLSVPTHARGWWSSQHPTIFTMWEFTRLPESFRSTLHNFETVLVPSFQNVELFTEFHDNVKYVPLGVDPEVWKYVPRTPPGLFFDFLIGGSGTRKGTDLAYKAFKALWGKDGSWGDGPIPRMIFKSPKHEDYTGERIERVGGRITAEEEVALYARAHCYLQPSRGEGWGLQPHQAIAQGLPTILTDAHGHESFSQYGFPLSTKLVPAAFSVYGDAGEWWEPDFDELCDHMLYVYEHYEEASAFAEVSAKAVLEELTWENTAKKFIDAVPGLHEDFVPSEWYTPDEKLYPVIVTRQWRADIAGTVHLFEPGKTYWERADVLRILFEAGLLDPACLTADDGSTNPGLSKSEVERIPDYSSAMGYCPTCSQRLGTQPMRSDELMAELA